MGVFDDAIREHLELKRHAGVDEEELKELEDEAFGQAARPGEPDFPGTSEEAAVEPDASATGDAPAATEAPAAAGVFDAETSVAETPLDAVIEAPPEEEPALTPIDEAALPETDEAALEPEVAPEPAEPAASEEPELAEEVGEAPLDPEEVSTFTTSEREAIADQPTVFFEQQEPAELELGDLELDIDEEIEEVGGSLSEPLPEEDEPLMVEEAFSEPAAETEIMEPPHEVEPEPAPPAEPEAAPESEPAADGEPGTSDDDVLEETPEFLRENPDDDELWFEQGEPKDFDF
jgi:nicotinate-nucleotide--dimethylbenzimidazole phosphoribosyltransferase